MKLQEAIKTEKFRDELHKASLNILYTAYWMRSHLSVVMKNHGITEEQFNVMRILKGKHPSPMCVRDIGSRMLEKSSNVPRIIDRLVAKKLVRRSTSTEDKRETLISLTDMGITHLEEVSKRVDEQSREIMHLPEAEAIQLNELLEKLRKKD
ncbi:MAG: MarR family transcriptional regulator [Sphingobacteriales bacterium]|nr:MAG: MarR family transcriptional regulator [Sphingobacteriales bacterium]